MKLSFFIWKRKSIGILIAYIFQICIQVGGSRVRSDLSSDSHTILWFKSYWNVSEHNAQ